MYLTADVQEGNGLQPEKFGMNFSSCFRRLQKLDIYDHGLLSLCKLRL